MRVKSRRWSAGAALAVLCVFGAAVAEPGDASPSTPGARRDVTLSLTDMIAEAKKGFGEMQTARESVRRALQEARQAKDKPREFCLEDALNQIDMAMRSANERLEALTAMQNAGGAADSPTSQASAKQDYLVFDSQRARVREALGEANQCIGEDAVTEEGTSVTMDIDPDVPDVDPSEIPDDPFDVSVPPTLKSETL